MCIRDRECAHTRIVCMAIPPRQALWVCLMRQAHLTVKASSEQKTPETHTVASLAGSGGQGCGARRGCCSVYSRVLLAVRKYFFLSFSSCEKERIVFCFLRTTRFPLLQAMGFCFLRAFALVWRPASDFCFLQACLALLPPAKEFALFSLAANAV